MPRPISLELSFDAIEHNLAVVLRRLEAGAGKTGRKRPFVWAVVKANAYGHGIGPAAAALAQADGLAMLDLDEAIRVREAGWRKPVLLLEGFFEARDIPVVRAHDLSVVVHCDAQLDMLEEACNESAVNIWLKLNTGMNRLGFMPGSYARAWARARALQTSGRVAGLGKMTHFSRADDSPEDTRAQLELFCVTTRGLPGPVSVCNSAATLSDDVWTFPGLQAHQQWVRPGVCLYGGSPFAQESAADFGLKPAQTLHSSLLDVRMLPAGAAIGYGHQYVTSRPMLTGIVACGYADGYPRHAPNGTPIVVDGVPTQVLGRVSMDMLAVDLSPLPQAQPGMPVVLWGKGGPDIDHVARAAGTIGYELMCAVAPRVPRRSHQKDSQ